MKTKIEFKQYLQIIREFQDKNPLSHVGGSVGLKLHGIDLQRELGDIDMISPVKIEDIPNDYEQSSEGTDFDAAYRKYLNPENTTYIKIDITIRDVEFDVVWFNGIKYNVSQKEDILDWKWNYARKCVKKHLEDLVVILGYKRVCLESYNDPDLPF